MRYSPERQETVLKEMLPPHNRAQSEFARKEGISETTLFRGHGCERSVMRLRSPASCQSYLGGSTRVCISGWNRASIRLLRAADEQHHRSGHALRGRRHRPKPTIVRPWPLASRSMRPPKGVIWSVRWVLPAPR